MLPERIRIFQHLKLRQKQIHIVVNRNITPLPEIQKDTALKQQKARYRKKEPVFCKPHEPGLFFQFFYLHKHICLSGLFTCISMLALRVLPV